VGTAGAGAAEAAAVPGTECSACARAVRLNGFWRLLENSSAAASSSSVRLTSEPYRLPAGDSGCCWVVNTGLLSRGATALVLLVEIASATAQ
jgi:hypothetical protein